MIQVVYRYILTAGTVLSCQVILQGCPSAVSVQPLLSLLLLFLLHVWHTRECIYHHFSLSQQHCIWKRIKEKGKADGTGMYMWTARHEEHRFLPGKLSFFKWVHMYILTDGDSQQSNLPGSILAGDENPAVQKDDADALPKSGFSSGCFKTSTAGMQEECQGLYSRRLWSKVLMRVRKCSLLPFPAFHSGSIQGLPLHYILQEELLF